MNVIVGFEKRDQPLRETGSRGIDSGDHVGLGKRDQWLRGTGSASEGKDDVC